MPNVTVTVRHRVGSGPRRTTRLEFTVPENIDPGHVDDFFAAMVEHAAARHQEQHFRQPDRPLVDALRRQVLTGILRAAADGPGRRLAARLLTVLQLSDRQLLQAHATPRRTGPNSG